MILFILIYWRWFFLQKSKQVLKNKYDFNFSDFLCRTRSFGCSNSWNQSNPGWGSNSNIKPDVFGCWKIIHVESFSCFCTIFWQIMIVHCTWHALNFCTEEIYFGRREKKKQTKNIHIKHLFMLLRYIYLNLNFSRLNMDVDASTKHVHISKLKY